MKENNFSRMQSTLVLPTPSLHTRFFLLSGYKLVHQLEPNHAEGRRLLEEAIESGDARAMAVLGSELIEGSILNQTQFEVRS